MSDFDIAIQKLKQIISIPIGIIFAFYLFLKVADEVEKTKEELKNYLKSRRVKISCCGNDLGEGKNICGYKSDYRCWEYKCPICDNKYYLYDYEEYKLNNE